MYAWTAPTANPPAGNVSAPINTSATAQTKAGNLTISATTTSSYFADLANPVFFVQPSGTSNFWNTITVGTTTTNGLRITNGATAGKVLTSDANGNASWQTPSGGTVGGLSLGSGCGAGSFVGDLTANNTSHGTFMSTTGTNQTITLPSDVKIFVLQGKGNDSNFTTDIWGYPTPNTGSGGASYAKSGSTWLVVAGGGGAGSGISGYGTGGTFGTKFTDGTFGMVASKGGAGCYVAGDMAPCTTSSFYSGKDGNTGSGGDGGIIPQSLSAYSAPGGVGGVGPSGDGGNSGPIGYVIAQYGGKGNAGVGGSSYSGGGGGYGGGGAGGTSLYGYGANGGGGGGGGYLDPRHGWVCEDGVYFKTSDTGYVIDIGSSASGTGGYAKIIY